MLKITSIAIGLLTILAMASNVQAMTAEQPAAIQTAQGEMHAQVGGTEEVKRDGERKREEGKRDGDKKRGEMKRGEDKKRGEMKRGDKKRGEDKKRNRKNRSESGRGNR
jgi:hypothetical protein